MAITEIVIWGIYVVLFLGALFQPIFGVLAYLAVYLTYDPEVWWAHSLSRTFYRPSFLAMAFLVSGCVFHLRKFNWKISRREREFYVFLCVAWIVTLFFGTGENENTWVYLDKITKIFVFLFIFIRVVHSFEQYKIVIWGLVFGGLLLVYQAHTIGGLFQGRLDDVGGIDFREANSLASFLAALVIFLGFEMLQSPLWKKTLYAVVVAAMVNTIIMTQSRAVFMGLTLSAPFVILLVSRRKRLNVAAYVCLGALLFVLLSDAKFINRVSTITNETSRFSAQTDGELKRWDFWRSSIHIFSDHPFGIGVKNFEKIVPYYDARNPGMDAHSTYVLCYTELGVFGIAIFVVIVAEALFQLRRIRKISKKLRNNQALENQANAMTLALLVYLLGLMITHSILYSQVLWMLLALPICLENAAVKLLQNEAVAAKPEEGTLIEDSLNAEETSVVGN
jgi:peptidoglycan/LPS O-acetylase OafA/YrhL